MIRSITCFCGSAAGDSPAYADAARDPGLLLAENDVKLVHGSGGLGTIAELVGILTWKQLGRHEKPITILDIEGYWTPMADLLTHIGVCGFSHGDLAGMFRIVSTMGELLDALNDQRTA